jgi:hypothetical protein
MRKPRNYDSELKALDERARGLRTRKLQQLGELVVATGADALSIDTLAGALLSAAEGKDIETQEVWRARGAAFFRRAQRKPEDAGQDGRGAPPGGGETLPFGASASPL